MSARQWSLERGARAVDDHTVRFDVWAPRAERIAVRLAGASGRTDHPLERRDDGSFQGAVQAARIGGDYFYVIDGGRERPDPVSRHQPFGVHGPSRVVDPQGFRWSDSGWRGVGMRDLVIYELHVGTFTEAGTFDATIERLTALRDLGITAIELMPVAECPGGRNWGYDGAHPYAAQSTYGGPEGLRRLVDRAHGVGLGVILDVVYNHLGPEGNYLAEFGPYFTDRYRTPWGQAVNFDGPESDEVRRYFTDNALYWVSEFHVDGLRLDAVHSIFDFSALHILAEIAAAVHALGETLARHTLVIAESDLNDPRIVRPPARGGYGLDGQWSDDFHHAVHAALTGERPNTTDGSKFVVCAQNHDQIGNRMLGDRLSTLVAYDKLKLAAAAVVLSPFIPMLFMGEEYGEKAPFQYFTSHSDADLIEAVRKGRLEEFDDFNWEGEPPDPDDEKTFLRSKLRWESLEHDEHRMLRRLVRELLRIRRDTPALRDLDLRAVETQAHDEQMTLLVKRRNALVAFNFSEHAATTRMRFAEAAWKSLIDTGAKIEANRITLPPYAFAAFSS